MLAILLGLYIGISLITAFIGLFGYCLGGKDDLGIFLEHVVIGPLFWPIYLLKLLS
jgi:hypothetical protein